MPKIPQKILGSVVYLYESKEDAKKGENFGGTGFLIGIRSEKYPDKRHGYVVTNWHVACRGGASVVRVNTKSGEPDIFDFDPSEWFFDPHYDIAIIPIPLTTTHDAVFLAGEMFVTQETAKQFDISPGEDVFMVGRFIDHDGKQTNKPFVRFGNISSLPVPLEQSNGKTADSYCIDMHSRTGFSGSPVFVYRTPGYDLDDAIDPNTPFAQRKVLFSGTNLLNLLGIHWGQFAELWEISSQKNIKENIDKHSLIAEGNYIKGVSGMTCVLPAWNIMEVLNTPKLKKLRDDDNKKIENSEPQKT